MKADRVLNAPGWNGLWCCLQAMSMLRTLEPAQVLKVLGTDPQALEDLPRILERTDSQLIGVEKRPDYFRLYLRRGPAAEGGRSGGK